MNYNNIPPPNQNHGHGQQYSQMPPPSNFHGGPFQPIKVDTSPHHQQPQMHQTHQGYYGQPVEMDIDYHQPRRAVSYGGPPPSFINQHCSPQIHAPPMQMQQHMDHQSGYMDSRNQMMPPQSMPQQMPPPQQPYSVYNGYPQQGLTVPSESQHSAQHSPMMRKISSHNGGPQLMQPHNEQQPRDNNNVHFMHQGSGYNNHHSQQHQLPPMMQQHVEPAPQRTLSTAGCVLNEAPPQERSLAWRKMSLAPNFRMNSSYGLELEPPVTQRQRTQSQALEVAKRKASLRQFSSHLRVPKLTGLANPMLSLIRYTPPPMLSPMRNGVGLFYKLSRKPSEYRKRSTFFDMATDVIMEEELPPSSSGGGQDSGIMDDMEQGISPCDQEEVAANPKTASAVPIRPPIDNRANRPKRKIGVFLCGQETNSTGFAAELEALRKESAESSMSGKSIEALTNGRYSDSRKCSTHASTSEDVIRKMSTVSMDEPMRNRKMSTMSEAYYDYIGCESDATPHINLGKGFQARVKKWSDREIMPHEREAIPDRDEPLFDCNVIDHLDDRTVAAYEALACSAAFPKLGRNKELALHILMENKGNIQAAVMDLLRCDTLDWEQYPIVYNYMYNDVDNWTPEEVSAFQDAIYKSEKDFHQVASELGNRTVKECVSFYYLWKKACPDDYRKLRNLRRKRQLLEQQLDYSSVSNKQDEKRLEDSSDEEIPSESESSIGTPAYVGNHSPEDCKPPKMARMSSPVAMERKASTVRFADTEPIKPDLHSQTAGNSMSIPSSLYPWLHGENGVFPSPSPTGAANNSQSYSQPPSVGANDLFNSSFGTDLLNQKIANIHRVTASKKGAQPSADGYFHCRLCDKRFEKVKSLNAHMKSHAMKARAEAEAQQQLQGNDRPSPSSQNQPSESARNFLLQQQRHQNGILGNQAHIDALTLQQQLNAARQSSNQQSGPSPNPSAASPMSLGQHLSRMAQFHPQMGLGNGNLNPAMNMFSPDMLSAMQSLVNMPGQGGVATSVATTAALQQLHNNLHSTTIIN